MHSVLTRTKYTSEASRFSFDDILDRGHVIFASNTASDARMVTFESPSDYYQNHTIGSRVRASQAAIGIGRSVEEAFRNAMHHFYSGNPAKSRTNRLLSMGRRQKHTNLKRSTLDRWLVEHKGTLRAVKDGEQVVCNLDGVHPTNPLKHVNLRGTGVTLSEALRSAFVGVL